MAYEAKKGLHTFSFYVIKRFTQIFVTVNQKMKYERELESYIIFFTTSYHLRPALHLPPMQAILGELVFHPSLQTPAQPKTTFLSQA